MEVGTVREVEVEKEEGAPLFVTLETSLLTGRVTVSAVHPTSPALGLLAPGDSILLANGAKLKDCEHASEVIQQAGRVQLKVIPSYSRLAAVVGIDFVDMMTGAQMMRKACILSFCCLLLFLVVPMQARVVSMQKDHQQLHDAFSVHTRHTDTAIGYYRNLTYSHKKTIDIQGSQLRLSGTLLEAERKSLSSERAKNEALIAEVRVRRHVLKKWLLTHVVSPCENVMHI